MIIEFSGLPGSGKSTAARMLQQHGFERVHIRSRTELVWRNLAYFLVHPIGSVVLLYRVFRAGVTQGRLYRFFMNVFLDTNARMHKARGIPNAIIDQGYVQGMLSLANYVVTPVYIQRYLKYLPAPDCTILFDAPYETRHERLSDRGYFPREGERGAEQWASAAQKNWPVIRDYLAKTQKGAHVVESGQSISSVVAKIRSVCTLKK